MWRFLLHTFHSQAAGRNEAGGRGRLIPTRCTWIRFGLWGLVFLGSGFSPVALADAPRVLAQPRGGTISAGKDFAFSVLPGGTPPFSYQWFFGEEPVAGGTNQILVLSGVLKDDAGPYAVDVSNEEGSVRSRSATLNVRDPAILAQPASVAAVGGGSATFTVRASGTPPLAYQWRFKGVPLQGATASSLVLANVTRQQAGSYTVVVSNQNGSITSTRATLSVGDPAILTPPVGATVTGGTNVIFSVEAGGTPPFTYQWRFRGVNLEGETNDTLFLDNVSRQDGGNYAVRVANERGAVLSPPAALVVNDPVILRPPRAAIVSQGDTICFDVEAVGSRPLRYQWLFKGVPVSGATNRELCRVNVLKSQAGSYAVRVTSEGGSVTSSSALLTVYDLVILTQPADASVAAGTNVQLSVEAAGLPPLSYQWLFDGEELPGETDPTLALDNVSTNQSGEYQVRITNPVGSLLSRSARLAVNDPFILEPPEGGVAVGGDTFALSVRAGGTPPLTYQWFRQETALPGATGDTLTLDDITIAEGGSYRVAVSNGMGGVLSAEVMVLVLDPVILSQPKGATVAVGSNITFSVEAAGNGPFSYQWFHDGTALTGATDPQLSLGNLTVDQGGDYTVEVGNADARLMSRPATLQVRDLLILEHPRSARLQARTNLTLSVVAAGTPPLQYQWRFKGVPLAGATNRTLELMDLTKAQAGRYAVQVRNASGSLLSSNATVTVDDPAIVRQPVGGLAGVGETFVFEVEAAGSEPLIYQWRRNRSALPGAVRPRLVLNDLTPSSAGTYAVQVRNASGRLLSANAGLTITRSTSAAVNAPRQVYTGEFTSDTDQAGLRLFLEGNGFENAVAFSIRYDPAVLGNPDFVPAGAATATTMDGAPGQVGVEVQLPPGQTYARTNAQELGRLQFDVLPGQDPLLAGFEFSNDPIAISASDVEGNAMDLLSALRPSGSLLDPVPLPFDQGGVFIQRLLLSNPTAFAISNLCLTVFDLGVDSQSNAIILLNGQSRVRVDANADGVAETPGFEACADLIDGSRSVLVTMEYLVTNHVTVPSPKFQFAFGTGFRLSTPRRSEGVRIEAARFVDGRFFLEFDTEKDFDYFIEYADTPEALNDRDRVRTSDPPARGTGGTFLWIDQGPPRTVSSPEEGARFYRVRRKFQP